MNAKTVSVAVLFLVLLLCVRFAIRGVASIDPLASSGLTGKLSQPEGPVVVHAASVEFPEGLDDHECLVTEQDVRQLPDPCGLAPVAALLRNHLLFDGLVYWCAAKSGGYYVFSFRPTYETGIPLAVSKTMDSELMLLAVIKADSIDDVLSARLGEYIYPAKLVGCKFSGFLSAEELAEMSASH